MSKRHTSREYEAELSRLRENLLRMTGYVESMIGDACRALIEADMRLAQRTIDADRQVNVLEVETDELCLLLLAKRQPLASDLRMITLAMKMVTDLERIGDLAANISERALALKAAPLPAVASKISSMSNIVQDMIRTAIDAFINRDVAEARGVFKRDQSVDDLYRELTERVQTMMYTDTSYVDRGVHLSAVAKFLERIGDHSTNLAEHVIFLVAGEDIRHKASRFAAEAKDKPEDKSEDKSESE